MFPYHWKIRYLFYLAVKYIPVINMCLCVLLFCVKYCLHYLFVYYKIRYGPNVDIRCATSQVPVMLSGARLNIKIQPSQGLPYIPRVHLSEGSLVWSPLRWLAMFRRTCGPKVLYSEVHLVWGLLCSEDSIFRKVLHYMDSNYITKVL